MLCVSNNLWFAGGNRLAFVLGPAVSTILYIELNTFKLAGQVGKHKKVIALDLVYTDHERKGLLWRERITLTWLPCIKATWIELHLLLRPTINLKSLK